MIRVLHVFDTLDRGGAESMVMNIYQKLDVQRVQLDFVVHTQDKCDYDDMVHLLGGRIHRAPRLKSTNLVQYLIWWNAFLKNHIEYKIIHCHVHTTASLYIPLAKRYGIKTIIHSHTTSNGMGFAAFVKNCLQYPLRYQADYLFACSEQSAKWMYGKKCFSRSNCFILKNSVDIEKFKFNSASRELYRKQISLRDGQLTLCHVGNFVEAKNHEFLIEFFSELVKRRDAVLILVGKYDNACYYNKRLTELGIADKVKILGIRNDVPEILCASDVFVFPSKWEGFPVAVLEAQASGLQVFVSDRVTPEVAVSDIVRFLPINCGTKVWVKSLMNYTYGRKDVAEQLRTGGYDVECNARWLTEFYETC